QVSKNLILYPGMDTSPYDQQAGASQTGGNKQHGEEKLGTHTKSHHVLLLALWPALTNKLVAHSMHSPEMDGVCRVLLKLLTHSHDASVARSALRIILIAPDFIQQLISSNDPLLVLHQELQRLEFLW